MAAKIKINKYLNLTKNTIGTKIPARIVLDLEEYKEINEMYGEEVGIHELDDVLSLPGFFTLEFPEEGDSIDFFLPYTVYIHKTEKTTKSKDLLTINFEADDIIFYANFKEEETNIRVLKSLFENGVKYLGDSPDKLISALWQQLMPNNNTPWFHLELIVSQLYGTYDKQSKLMKPLRLTGLPYSKKYIMNLKESAHNLNQSMPILYGYSKDALRSMVQTKKRGKNSFFENVVSGDYDEITKEQRKAVEDRKIKALRGED